MSNNIFGFVSEDTFAEKMDEQNRLLAAIAANGGDSMRPTNWVGVQAIVRAGMADKVFAIGDQFACKRGNDVLYWDVIGIDHDTPTDSNFTHSLTLQLHDIFPTYMQFSNKQAIFKNTGTVPMAAGTYYFTVAADFGNASAGTYKFTLANAVPAGGVIAGLSSMYSDGVAGQSISTYASSSATTPIETVTVSSGSGGTELGTLRAAGDSTNHVNSIHRIAFGSDNYKESAIRQWLNSEAAAGSVWAPQTNFDRPPTWAASSAGFLNGMDSDFVAAIGKTHITVSRNQTSDGGGSDTLDDKIFLISKENVYMGGEIDGVNEGARYLYYKNYSDLTEPGMSADSNRIKYMNGTPHYWYLRTPDHNNAYNVRSVSATGAGGSTAAYNAGGIVPACNII